MVRDNRGAGRSCKPAKGLADVSAGLAIPPARITSHDPGQVAISAIVSDELYYGAHKSTRGTDSLRRLAMLLRDIEPLALTPDDAATTGEIRATLDARGTPIGPYDALIAGQVRSRDLVLVTNNTREFRRVENLTVVDWLTES